MWRGFSAQAMTELDDIVSAVRTSKKYRTVCPDTIRRIAARELANRHSTKEAIKATKRKLHQVYAAFEDDAYRRLDYDAAYKHLEAAYGSGSEAQIRDACRRILATHSSTRERLSILDSFYQAIWGPGNQAGLSQPNTILDLGCGLNPLALPWMGLSPGARYIALDIDTSRIRFLNRLLALAGLEPLARCQDVLARPPDDVVDLALLLKVSPTLERQEPGSTLRLMQRLKAPCIVVSFAVKSLGGHEKGMANHYQRQFSLMMEEASTEVLVFETELVYVVKT